MNVIAKLRSLPLAVKIGLAVVAAAAVAGVVYYVFGPVAAGSSAIAGILGALQGLKRDKPGPGQVDLAHEKSEASRTAADDARAEEARKSRVAVAQSERAGNDRARRRADAADSVFDLIPGASSRYVDKDP